MIDTKDFLHHPEKYKHFYLNRGLDVSVLDNLQDLLHNRNKLIQQVNHLQSERNQITKDFQKATSKDVLHDKMATLKHSLSETEAQLEEVEKQCHQSLLELPNILDNSVPQGVSEMDNQEQKKWGEIPNPAFTVLPHYEIAEYLNILDLSRGVKIAKSRFYILSDTGARLERALINFFLDEASKAGYHEINAPYIVNGKSMLGTGQLPKFSHDVFKIEDEDLYLIPTAEVSLTNIYADEILHFDELPKGMVGVSSCFRKEAGSYGRDTRGIFRVHQFQKVEIVKYAKPENSDQELEVMTRYCEKLLEQLKLPYRRMLLCSQDTGFSSMKTYDLEVYLPSLGVYREISSCSNFGCFQARRAKIRYKDKEGSNHYIHTLNASSLAVGRTMIAILENYQNEDKTVSIPEVLQPYMNGQTLISLSGE